MTRIEEIENLLDNWKAAIEACEPGSFGWSNAKYSVGALESALKILKRPSNTRMQIDTLCKCPKVAEGNYFCNLKNGRGECAYGCD